MTSRREFMDYIGTGAIGGIVGYYIGAQELLGIQSEKEVVAVQSPSPDDRSSSTDDLSSPTDDLSSPTDDLSNDNSTPTTTGRVIDDFESREISEWTVENGERSDLEFVSDSAVGRQSLYFVDRDKDENTTIYRNLDIDATIQSFSFWVKYNSENDNHFTVQLFNSNEDISYFIREYSSSIRYRDSNRNYTTIADIQQNEWYKIELYNIDFQSQNANIRVNNYNGSTVGELQEMPFVNDAAEFSKFRVSNGLGNNGDPDPLWLDHIVYQTTPTEDTPTEDTLTEDANNVSDVNIYDNFEDGTLNSPDWRKISGDAQNEIGIAQAGHESQYSLFLDQGGSIENFGAESVLGGVVSPSTISFWIEPTGSDGFTKHHFRFRNGDTDAIIFSNRVQNDNISFVSGDPSKKEGRVKIRDSAIPTDVGRFVEIRLANIDWNAGEISEVYVDGTLTAEVVPFRNTVSGIDRLAPYAVGGGETAFRVDDIGWK